MSKITLIQWDITEQETDAIVNAANRTLLGWWGVDWAIHWAGWPAIMEACDEIRNTTYPDWLPTGEAVITVGGKLFAKYVIHTVWPIFSRYKDESWKIDLANCYVNCLKIATENNLKSISFPSISTGIYRCPIQECSKIAIDTVKNFLSKNQQIEEVRFILFSESDYKVYQNMLCSTI